MSLHIRPATADDAELILRFITELAIYEKAEHEVRTDVEGIRASLFAADGPAHALICERDRLCGVLLQLLHLAGQARPLPRGPLRQPRGPRPGCRQGAAAPPGEARRGTRLRTLRVGGAGLEHTGHRVLPILRGTPQEEWTIYRLTGQALLDFAAGED